MIQELNGDFLQWLRGFYYVAKTGSVRQAAEQMRRNPSTISYQISRLEDELGTVLFDRHKKSLRITPEGETLLEWTISAFDTLQGLVTSVGSARGRLQGSVRVAATLPIASLALNAISEFIVDHPAVKLTIERFLSEGVRQAVADSTVDFGLLPVIAQPESDKLEVVATARPLLIAHRDNPWKIPHIPEVADLERLPYIAFGNRDCTDDFGNYIMDSGMGDFIARNAVVKVNNYHLSLRFTRNRLGVAIMDEMSFQASNFGADWEELHAYPLDHIFPNRRYGLLTRQHKRLSPQATALMNSLKSFFQSLARINAERAWEGSRKPYREEAVQRKKSPAQQAGHK